jgi:hypothetical protein
MLWSWEVLDRIYFVCRVNIGSLGVLELINASPQCHRAMLNEFRADAKKSPIDPKEKPDGDELAAVIRDFFGLSLPTVGTEEKPNTGVAEPPSTSP